MLLRFKLTFKCQQHASLTAYNRMRAAVVSAVLFLDGTLLCQHAAVCLLVLFFFISLQFACADFWLRRRKYEPVEVASLSGLCEVLCQMRQPLFCSIYFLSFRLFILENTSIKTYELTVELKEFLSLMIFRGVITPSSQIGIHPPKMDSIQFSC